MLENVKGKKKTYLSLCCGKGAGPVPKKKGGTIYYPRRRS